MGKIKFFSVTLITKFQIPNLNIQATISPLYAILIPHLLVKYTQTDAIRCSRVHSTCSCFDEMHIICVTKISYVHTFLNPCLHTLCCMVLPCIGFCNILHAFCCLTISVLKKYDIVSLK